MLQNKLLSHLDQGSPLTKHQLGPKLPCKINLEFKYITGTALAGISLNAS